MKKIKYIIPFMLLIIVIGYAVISTSLGIGGKTYIASDADDFKVYFSKVLVDGEEEKTAILDSTTINYTRTLTSIGESYTITYDVTNASKEFDAEISINCTTGDEYLSVTNSFDTSILLARTTRTGTLTFKKTKSNSSTNEKNYTITCEIKATAIGRTETATGEVPGEVEGYPYTIGKEVTIDTETFNIINEADNNITLLAQYNLGTDYRQTEEAHELSFSDEAGWEYTPGPKEIDIQTWSTNPKTYINEYTTYLQAETGDTSLSGNLITLKELEKLGCVISTDYSIQDGMSCESSKYASWIINNQWWFTRSAGPDYNRMVWVLTPVGKLNDDSCTDIDGIRPTITISKETLDKYL